MPTVIERKPTAFYGGRTGKYSYASHVEARTSKKSGYYRSQKARLDAGAIDKDGLAAALTPYTEEEWIDEQGSLDGPIEVVTTSGVEVVMSQRLDKKGKVETSSEEQPYDDRTDGFEWSEITEAEYGAIVAAGE